MQQPSSTVATALPTADRLLAWAVLLPAAVAASNYAMLFGHLGREATRGFLYPWMAASTAVLGWCIGRYLWPWWLQWLVLGWALLLLDLLTISACLAGPLNRTFGYILVTAQIGFLVVWAVLGRHGWQMRLPMAVVAAAIVIGFSGSFDSSWSSPVWNVMFFVVTVELAFVCIGLRWLGFSIRRPAEETAIESNNHDRSAYQFGTRHMLIWATAVAPLLVVARGLDFVFIKVFEVSTILPAVFIAVTLASVCLVAIWAVLGAGNLVARLAALLVVPAALGFAMQFVTRILSANFNWTSYWNAPILRVYYDVGRDWVEWTCLTAALLAALLLFLRAGGYQLSRARPAEAA